MPHILLMMHANTLTHTTHVAHTPHVCVWVHTGQGNGLRHTGKDEEATGVLGEPGQRGAAKGEGGAHWAWGVLQNVHSRGLCSLQRVLHSRDTPCTLGLPGAPDQGFWLRGCENVRRG